MNITIIQNFTKVLFSCLGLNDDQIIRNSYEQEMACIILVERAEFC